MAFSTTVRSKTPIGPALCLTAGDWSGAAGDAAGTIDVSGGYVLGALFFKMDASGNSSQIFPTTSLSTTGNVTTITVQNQDNVTTGRFIIFHGGA